MCRATSHLPRLQEAAVAFDGPGPGGTPTRNPDNLKGIKPGEVSSTVITVSICSVQ